MKFNKNLYPSPDEIASATSMLLRRPHSADLAFMLRMEQDPENRKFTLVDEMPEQEDLEELIRKGVYLETDGQCRLVLQIGKNPAGLIDLYEADLKLGLAWVGIIIDKPFRRAGWGLLCLKELESIASSSGIKYLHAMVHPLNFPALSLFRLAGYRPYEDSEKAGYMVMKKEIAVVIPLRP